MTSPIDLTNAPEIAQELFEVLVARWPSFANHASLREGGDLVFEVPRGTVDGQLSPEPLFITADSDLDETIIAFGGGHSHGGAWRSPDDPDFQFRGGLSFVENILEERVMGFSMGAAAGLAFKETIDAMEGVTRVRSWRGTYDRG